MKAAKPKVSDSHHSEILAILHRTYPDFRCALNHQNPLQLLVATILSAQCTDERVNHVTPLLFQRCRSAKDFADIPTAELEAIIRPTGFFRNKARSIQQCARAIDDRHQGQVPQTLAELVALDGVGRKTANVVLGVAFGRAEGVVVDTHVARLSRRLGLTRQRTPEKIEQSLMRLYPVSDWIDLSHLLIWHGRRRCPARRPDCENCEIKKLCPRVGVEGK